VFVIIMENKSHDEALRGTYTASLASQYAIATNYHAVSHPSEPNYLALTSGARGERPTTPTERCRRGVSANS
jgi:phosphatidylinositol-3-phosphatase